MDWILRYVAPSVLLIACAEQGKPAVRAVRAPESRMSAEEPSHRRGATPATPTSGQRFASGEHSRTGDEPSGLADDVGGAGQVPEQLASLPMGSRVLHVGDSFAGALGYELNEALAAEGVKGTLKYQKSTYIPTWAWGKELGQHLARYNPDLVLITLGGNELQIPDPSKRIPTIARLVGRLQGRPCVWIGIPLWKDADPRLPELIREHAAPCLYLDSTALIPDMDRAGDGIHPSKSAQRLWAASVVHWLKEHQDPAASTWKWR